MKNKVFLFIFVMLAMCQISFGQSQGSSTLTFDQDYLTYAIDNGNAIVTSCSSDANGEITIPEMVSFKRKKYPVTGIGENAFKGNKIC